MRRKADAACRVCGHRPRVVTATDLYGRTSYQMAECRHETRIRGRQCCDCGKPHGKTGCGWRCGPCQDARRKVVNRLSSRRRNGKENTRANGRRYWKNAPEEVKERKRERDRARNANPEFKAKRKRYLETTYWLVGAPKHEQYVKDYKARQARKRQQEEAA